MAPEVHRAQVLPDLDMGSKEVTWGPGPSGFGARKGNPPLLNQGRPATFVLLKFSPKHMVEAPEAPQTHFTHPIPGGWGAGLKPPQEPSPLKDHLDDKFHSNPSSSLNLYREQTPTHTLQIYIVDSRPWLRSCIC